VQRYGLVDAIGEAAADLEKDVEFFCGDGGRPLLDRDHGLISR
jgi:hypothetical protein